MNKQKNNREQTPQPEQDIERDEQLTNSHENDLGNTSATEEEDKVADPVEELTAQLAALNDTHLRLMAEYDNYRKRTLKEKSELIRNGGEKVLVDLLPVIDDFERALNNLGDMSEPAAIKEGVELIYSKFMDYLQKQGVKKIETADLPFDADLFDAVAMIPAPSAEQKGKVIDCVKTGYTLNDKVIRHAHVVVGE
ncbi:nucleotide exchange factor GrpE [Porphyromonas gulae]|uniref:nucleotide exchange factor GrpE n=1 Tax=Porphyromonas gulae TaxID=111105 RepID=UPI00052E04FB|nr:nucleotide exchange factor GrpE [Porphyromonas gulae]KGO01989.1 molecular chaperone GrpE [Porphyromonas gulae]KKC51474.1 molecular chaperone GrpE [Porphyromonas gulae]